MVITLEGGISYNQDKGIILCPNCNQNWIKLRETLIDPLFTTNPISQTLKCDNCDIEIECTITPSPSTFSVRQVQTEEA